MTIASVNHVEYEFLLKTYCARNIDSSLASGTSWPRCIVLRNSSVGALPMGQIFIVDRLVNSTRESQADCVDGEYVIIRSVQLSSRKFSQ